MVCAESARFTWAILAYAARPWALLSMAFRLGPPSAIFSTALHLANLAPAAAEAPYAAPTRGVVWCGAVTCAGAPAGVDAPVQYGSRLTAVVYLLVASFEVQKCVASTVTECRDNRVTMH